MQDVEGMSEVERYKMKCRVLKEKVRGLERELTMHRAEAIKSKALEKHQKKMEQEPLTEQGLLARRGGELKEIGGRLIDSLDEIVKREEKQYAEVKELLERLHEKEDVILALIMDHARLRTIPAAPPLPASPSTIGSAALNTVLTAIKVHNNSSPPLGQKAPAGGQPPASPPPAEGAATLSVPSTATSSVAGDPRNDEALRNAELAIAALKESKDEELRIAQGALTRERAKTESLENLVRSLERGIREEKVKLVELKFRLQREKVPLPGHLLELLGSNRVRGAQTQAALISRGIVLEDTLSTSAPSSTPTLLAPSSYQSTSSPSATAQAKPQSVSVVVPPIRMDLKGKGASQESPASAKDVPVPSSSESATAEMAPPSGEGKWVRKQSSRALPALKAEEEKSESPREPIVTLGGRRTLLGNKKDE